jgi:hypothetical protein
MAFIFSGPQASWGRMLSSAQWRDDHMTDAVRLLQAIVLSFGVGVSMMV